MQLQYSVLDLTPVLLTEASLDPTPKRREDLGHHTVYTPFPKDRNRD